MNSGLRRIPRKPMAAQHSIQAPPWVKPRDRVKKMMRHHAERRGPSPQETPLTDAIHSAARNEQSIPFQLSDLRVAAMSDKAAAVKQPVQTDPTPEQVDVIEQFVTPLAPNSMLTADCTIPKKNIVLPLLVGLSLPVLLGGVVLALLLDAPTRSASPAPTSVGSVVKAAAVTRPTARAKATKAAATADNVDKAEQPATDSLLSPSRRTRVDRHRGTRSKRMSKRQRRARRRALFRARYRARARARARYRARARARSRARARRTRRTRIKRSGDNIDALLAGALR